VAEIACRAQKNGGQMKLIFALLGMVALWVIPWPESAPSISHNLLMWPVVLGLGCIAVMVAVMIEVTYKGLRQSKGE